MDKIKYRDSSVQAANKKRVAFAENYLQGHTSQHPSHFSELLPILAPE